MEKWLCSGITKEDVENQFEKMWELDFPEPPCDEAIGELYAELVSLDMTIMGAVSTFLEDEILNLNYNYSDDEFNRLAEKVQQRDKSYKEIMDYKMELDKLKTLFKDMK